MKPQKYEINQLISLKIILECLHLFRVEYCCDNNKTLSKFEDFLFNSVPYNLFNLESFMEGKLKICFLFKQVSLL